MLWLILIWMVFFRMMLWLTLVAGFLIVATASAVVWMIAAAVHAFAPSRDAGWQRARQGMFDATRGAARLCDAHRRWLLPNQRARA